MEKFDQHGRPVRIKVGSLDYQIDWRNDWVGDRYKPYGQCDNIRQLITLTDDLTADRLVCTFMHELYHALFSVVTQHENETLTEEAACNLGSYQTVGFWRDNPRTFAWWIGLVKGDGKGETGQRETVCSAEGEASEEEGDT